MNSNLNAINSFDSNTFLEEKWVVSNLKLLHLSIEESVFFGTPPQPGSLSFYDSALTLSEISILFMYCNLSFLFDF